MSGCLVNKNGWYHMVIYHRDESGKLKPKWQRTGLRVKGNKKAAQEMLEATIKQFDNVNIDEANILFSQYMLQWLERTSFDLQKSTLRGYKGIVQNHIVPYFASKRKKLIDLKVRDLEAFYAYLHSKNLSPQSIRNNHAVLSKALNDAVRLDMIAKNPAQYAKRPKVEPYIGEFRNSSELNDLVAMFKDTHIANAVKFAAIYGLRRGELLGLCWDVIDFQNNQFVIRRSLIQNTGENYLKNSTKNSSSYRALPLTNEAKTILIQIQSEQEENRYLLGKDYEDNNYIFTWPDGKPLSPNFLSKTFHQVQIRNGLKPIRFHDLRHSVASNLIAKGFSFNEVQNWLGHSQASTTLNIYCHVDSSSKRNIQQSLDEEWSG